MRATYPKLALLFREEKTLRRFRASIPRVEPVASVGAGDVLLAGFLAARFNNRPFDDALRQAIGCAAASVVELGPGRFDPQRLEQVMSNLLSNAMKYGAAKPVTIRCEQRDGRAIVSFEDHGIGIAPEDRDRVFRRFERAVSERNYAGLGLGLWITRELVAAHGGTIALETELGRGSTFTVSLPLNGV